MRESAAAVALSELWKAIRKLTEEWEALRKRLDSERSAGPALPKLLKMKAAAWQLSVSPRTLNRMIRDGEIGFAIPTGTRRKLIPLSEIERLATPLEKAPRERPPPRGYRYRYNAKQEAAKIRAIGKAEAAARREAAAAQRRRERAERAEREATAAAERHDGPEGE